MRAHAFLDTPRSCIRPAAPSDEIGPIPSSLAFSPGGRYLAAGRTDATPVMARNPLSCNNAAADASNGWAFLDFIAAYFRGRGDH